MARLRAVLRQHWNADRNNAIEVLGRQSDRSWKLIIGDPIGASKKQVPITRKVGSRDSA